MWNFLKFLGTLFIDKDSNLSKPFQYVGSTGLVTGVFSNITELVSHIKWNATFLTATSVLGVFYLLMKMYDQYLITKRRKKTMKEEIKKEIKQELDV